MVRGALGYRGIGVRGGTYGDRGKVVGTVRIVQDIAIVRTTVNFDVTEVLVGRVRPSENDRTCGGGHVRHTGWSRVMRERGECGNRSRGGIPCCITEGYLVGVGDVTGKIGEVKDMRDAGRCRHNSIRECGCRESVAEGGDCGFIRGHGDARGTCGGVRDHRRDQNRRGAVNCRIHRKRNTLRC